jgi:hypothetical protein
LRIGASRNVFLAQSTYASEHIMNAINFAARFAQVLLAVTIVFVIGLLFQLSLIY